MQTFREIALEESPSNIKRNAGYNGRHKKTFDFIVCLQIAPIIVCDIRLFDSILNDGRQIKTVPTLILHRSTIKQNHYKCFPIHNGGVCIIM